MGRARGAAAAAVGVSPRTSSPAPSPSSATARIETFQRYTDEHGSPLRSPELPEYDGLLIEFARELTDREREQVRGTVCYWAFLPFVANGTDVNEWLTNRHFWIDANSLNSRSGDWRKRDIFADLEEMLVEGTPRRKRQENTRKWEGVGTAPERIILSHPGHKAPRTAQPAEPLREGRKGPLFGIESADQLLSVRTP